MDIFLACVCIYCYKYVFSFLYYSLTVYVRTRGGIFSVVSNFVSIVGARDRDSIMDDNDNE